MRLARCEQSGGEQPVQDAGCAGAQPVVLEPVGDPGAQAAYGTGGVQGVVRVDVHVVVVDGCGDRDLVDGEPGRVVERLPAGVCGEQSGGLRQRAQRRVSVEHPRSAAQAVGG